jgi:deoxycytidylate deaminase
MAQLPKIVASDTDEGVNKNVEVAEISNELIIGMIGYAGAGSSTAASKLEASLVEAGYEVQVIKLSTLIQQYYSAEKFPVINRDANEGIEKLKRAKKLQDLGDTLRQNFGPYAVASLAIKEVVSKRKGSVPGAEKKAFLLDSLKHAGEVELLRKVYDTSFRLVAVHCDRSRREQRLIGARTSGAKYRGADEAEVREYIDRDEGDQLKDSGQQVREAFYLADYFLDNNAPTNDGLRVVADIERFTSLILGTNLVKPTFAEEGMYHAFAASLRSSCLSRQVGAALQSPEGQLISIGTNEVPRYGGGIYAEGETPDHRCFKWDWDYKEQKFTGCHNQRKKKELREDIAMFLSSRLAEKLAEAAHPKPTTGSDIAERARTEATQAIVKVFKSSADTFEKLPGVKDLVEYSRSIHAEMSALFGAARERGIPKGSVLFCTTFPCHNCARHLITAGIARVFYVEPYVKSLATELHYDAIGTEWPSTVENGPSPQKMLIVPFTGVGPRLYNEVFLKVGDLKDKEGKFMPPSRGRPVTGVRLKELESIEERAANLVQ